jgi:hypothetical protein
MLSRSSKHRHPLVLIGPSLFPDDSRARAYPLARIVTQTIAHCRSKIAHPIATDRASQSRTRSRRSLARAPAIPTSSLIAPSICAALYIPFEPQRAAKSRRSPIFASRPVAPCISHDHSRFASRSFLISTFLSSFTSLHASRLFDISFTFSTSFAFLRILFHLLDTALSSRSSSLSIFTSGTSTSPSPRSQRRHRARGFSPPRTSSSGHRKPGSCSRQTSWIASTPSPWCLLTARKYGSRGLLAIGFGTPIGRTDAEHRARAAYAVVSLGHIFGIHVLCICTTSPDISVCLCSSHRIFA